MIDSLNYEYKFLRYYACSEVCLDFKKVNAIKPGLQSILILYFKSSIDNFVIEVL